MLQGIEATIDAAGQLDLTDDETATFDVVLAAGCLFALDSDAHTTTQLSYAETALAHARLAAIPAERTVNCWPLDRLLGWMANPSGERR